MTSTTPDGPQDQEPQVDEPQVHEPQEPTSSPVTEPLDDTSVQPSAAPATDASAHDDATAVLPAVASDSPAVHGTVTDEATAVLPTVADEAPGTSAPSPAPGVPLTKAPAPAERLGATVPPAAASYDVPDEAPSRRLRVATIVWGLMLTAVGIWIIAWASGARIDAQLALICLLAAGGVALLVGSIVSGARHSRR